MPSIKFFPSQIGSPKLSTYSYTGSPLLLLRHDIYLALKYLSFAPFIVFPLSPHLSGHLCELYPSLPNLWNMFLHFVLMLLQLPFLFSIPFWIIIPTPLSMILLCVAVFWAANWCVWRLLNGGQMQFYSQDKFAGKKKEHEHEQWIFLNGVAVGYVNYLCIW